MTPAKYCHGASKCNYFTTKSKSFFMKSTDLETINCVTMVRTVRSSVDPAIHYWIFKGKSLPYQMNSILMARRLKTLLPLPSRLNHSSQLSRKLVAFMNAF